MGEEPGVRQVFITVTGGRQSMCAKLDGRGTVSLRDSCLIASDSRCNRKQTGQSSGSQPWLYHSLGTFKTTGV